MNRNVIDRFFTKHNKTNNILKSCICKIRKGGPWFTKTTKLKKRVKQARLYATAGSITPVASTEQSVGKSIKNEFQVSQHNSMKTIKDGT